MRLLLTSGGVTNPSIRKALESLLGKPISEANALIIPTAAYWFDRGPEIAYRLITGTARSPLTELGWKSLGVLELTALASVEKDAWVPRVRSTDAFLVGGGDPQYLADWMRKSGFADLIPSLRPEVVYIGISGGSQALTPSLGASYNDRDTRGYRPLALVDFSMGVHVDHPDMPQNSMAEYEKWAADIPNPTYICDDATAIQVVDGTVDVISEGHWKLVNESRNRA